MNPTFPVLKRLGSIRGIANGAVATAEIPARGTHYGIFLYARTSAGVALTAAQMKADIGDIIIRVNGEQKLELSATQLLELQKYYGDAEVAGNISGVIPIFLYPRNLATWIEKALFAYGMANVDSFTIDIKLASSLAQLSTLDLWTYSTDEVRNLGQHIVFRRFPQNFAATGLQEISTLVKEGDDVAYKSLHIEIPGSSVIDYVTLKVDGNLVHDQVPVGLNNVLGEDGKRKEQSGYYTIALDKINDLSGMLSMQDVKDFRQQINWLTAAPNNFNIIAEMIKGLKTVKK